MMAGRKLKTKDFPPGDLDNMILTRMIKGAGMFYKIELGRGTGDND